MLDKTATTRPIRLLSILAVAALLSTLGACSQPSPKDDELATQQADAEPVDVHFLGFNDFHGHLKAPAGTLAIDGEEVDAGGAAVLAEHVRQFRNDHEHTAVVSAGDLIGASPLVSALFHDEPTIEVFNEIGLDAVAVGNHEFDAGWNELVRIAEGGCHPEDGCRDGYTYPGASFPYLAANVLRPDGETLFDPYVVREYDGVEVAFVGLTLDDMPSIVMPSGIEGLTFRNEWETINEHVTTLQERGIESIVVLIHEGGVPSREPEGFNDCSDLEGPIVEIAEKSDDAVDAFVTGHTHQIYNCRIDGKLVTSAKSQGMLVTEYDLAIDRQSGDVVEMSAENIPVRSDGTPDNEVASLVDQYDQLASERADRPVGQLTETLARDPNDAGQMPLGSVIADAQLEATAGDETRAQVAFMNPGGVRNSLDHDGDDDTADVTYGDLHAAQPFRNQLVTMTLTGQQIHDLLERQWRGGAHPTILQVSSGFSYTWHPDQDVGNRVDPESITFDGQPIDLEADYRVTVNNFLAEGGDGFEILKAGKDVQFGPLDIDALKAYFEKHSPVSAPTSARLKRAD